MTAHQQSNFKKIASTLIGAFFLLCFSACKDKKSTSDWQQSEPAEHPAEKVTTKSDATKNNKQGVPATGSQGKSPVRFLAYNLKNSIGF